LAPARVEGMEIDVITAYPLGVRDELNKLGILEVLLLVCVTKHFF
jgi:hypothetical protein